MLMTHHCPSMTGFHRASCDAGGCLTVSEGWSGTSLLVGVQSVLRRSPNPEEGKRLEHPHHHVSTVLLKLSGVMGNMKAWRELLKDQKKKKDQRIADLHRLPPPLPMPARVHAIIEANGEHIKY